MEASKTVLNCLWLNKVTDVCAGAWKVTGQGELRNERMKKRDERGGRGIGVSRVCLCGRRARGGCECVRRARREAGTKERIGRVRKCHSYQNYVRGE